jgi:hypothetical protein
MPDARCTRGRLCSKKAQALATKGTPQQPAFPARWFYGLYVISPVTGLFCHRHSQRCLHELSASVGAPGPHDFAVREAARTSAHSPRPPHPALYVRDDRETPLVRRRDGIGIFLFLPRRQEKFLKFRNWPGANYGGSAAWALDQQRTAARCAASGERRRRAGATATRCHKSLWLSAPAFAGTMRILRPEKRWTVFIQRVNFDTEEQDEKTEGAENWASRKAKAAWRGRSTRRGCGRSCS